jgi:hypothetical protein
MNAFQGSRNPTPRRKNTQYTTWCCKQRSKAAVRYDPILLTLGQPLTNPWRVFSELSTSGDPEEPTVSTGAMSSMLRMPLSFSTVIAVLACVASEEKPDWRSAARRASACHRLPARVDVPHPVLSPLCVGCVSPPCVQLRRCRAETVSSQHPPTGEHRSTPDCSPLTGHGCCQPGCATLGGTAPALEDRGVFARSVVGGGAHQLYRCREEWRRAVRG